MARKASRDGRNWNYYHCIINNITVLSTLLYSFINFCPFHPRNKFQKQMTAPSRKKPWLASSKAIIQEGGSFKLYARFLIAFYNSSILSALSPEMIMIFTLSFSLLIKHIWFLCCSNIASTNERYPYLHTSTL